MNEHTMRRAERDIADALDVLSQPSRLTQNEILVGKPGEELVKAAAEWRADLIVVGSRTPSRIRKYLIGSTAEMVAREALASVLVVR